MSHFLSCSLVFTFVVIINTPSDVLLQRFTAEREASINRKAHLALPVYRGRMVQEPLSE